MSDERAERLRQVAGDFHDEHQVLDGIVAVLDVDAWQTATPSEGWTVADQINHLAFFDERARHALVDPDGFQELVDRDLHEGAERLDEHLDRGREMEPSELLDWSRDAHATLMAALDAVDPEARVPWYGPAMSPPSFVTARLMETWAHGRDVADGLGVTPEPTDRLRHIADLGVRTRGWSYRLRGLPENATPVRVELDGPSGDRWSWGDDDATDKIEGPVEDFCLVVTQRRKVSSSALVCTGEAAREWMVLAQAYAGAPGTGR